MACMDGKSPLMWIWMTTKNRLHVEWLLGIAAMVVMWTTAIIMGVIGSLLIAWPGWVVGPWLSGISKSPNSKIAPRPPLTGASRASLLRCFMPNCMPVGPGSEPMTSAWPGEAYRYPNRRIPKLHAMSLAGREPISQSRPMWNNWGRCSGGYVQKMLHAMSLAGRTPTNWSVVTPFASNLYTYFHTIWCRLSAR